MAGKVASIIIIASIFITGFVGYLANVDMDTDERAVYDYSANLVPIASLSAEDVLQYSEYNPTTNVTGWYNEQPGISNARVQSTNIVSPYILRPMTTDYIVQTPISFANKIYVTDYNATINAWLFENEIAIRNVSNSSGAYIYTDIDSLPQSQWDIDGPYLYTGSRATGENISDSYYYVGGYGGHRTFTSTDNTYDYYVKVYDSNNYELASNTPNDALYLVPLSVISEYETGDNAFRTTDVITMTGYQLYAVSAESDIKWDVQIGGTSSDRIITTTWEAVNAVNIYTGSESNVGLMYNADAQGWYTCHKNTDTGFWEQDGVEIYPSSKLFLLSSAVPISVGYEKVVVTPATYADNSAMVDIGVLDVTRFGTSAVWENGQSNGKITFLAKLNNTTGSLNIKTYNMSPGVPNNIYTLNGEFSVSPWSSATNPDGVVTPTGYVLIEIDSRYKTATVSAVTSYSNTLNYTTSGYKQNLDIITESTGTDMMRLVLTYEHIVGQAYIESTVVQLDPDGLLWGNPEMYLQYYFPSAFEDIGRTNIPRVWFNSFVSVGTNITINGQNYAVSEGQITVGETKVNLKGMAVEWNTVNSVIHVFIVPAGDEDRAIDIGELDTTPVSSIVKENNISTEKITTLGYNIGMDGVWYFEVGLYTGHIEEFNTVGLNITKGWGLSIAGTAFVFIGSIILCTAITVYYGRDTDYEPGILDWVILGMVLGIVLIIIG